MNRKKSYHNHPIRTITAPLVPRIGEGDEPPAPPAEPPAPPAPPAEPPAPQNVRAEGIAALLKEAGLPVPTQELEDAVAAERKAKGVATPPAPPTPPAPVATPPAAGEGDKPPAPPAEPAKPKTLEVEFLGGKKTIGAEEEPKGPPTLNDETTAGLKAFFGDDADIPAYLQKALDYDKVATEKQQIEAEHTKVTSALSLVPNELAVIVDEAIANPKSEAWREKMRDLVTTDFSKPYEAQDRRAMIERYFPGTTSEDDDFDNIAEDKRLLALDNQAKLKFAEEKAGIEKKRQEDATAIEASQTALQSSVQKAVEYAEKSLQGIKPSIMQAGIERLKNNALTALFYNPDGSYREDAVVRAIMTENAEATIKNYEKVMAKLMKTAALEEVLPKVKAKAEPTTRAAAPTVGRVDDTLRLHGLRTTGELNLDHVDKPAGR